MEPLELAIPVTHPVNNAQGLFLLNALLVLQPLQCSQEVFAFLVHLASFTTQAPSSAKLAVPSVPPAQEELPFALPV